MTWEQNVVHAETGREFARGEVIVVAYNYEEKKTIPIPGDWCDKIVKFEGLEQEKDAA